MKKKSINVSFDYSPLNFSHFEDFARWWYDHHEKIEESTRDGYQYTLEKLIETFGPWLLTDIKPYHIEAYLNAAMESVSHTYVCKLRSMLNQIFRKAVANNLIPSNPVALIDPIRSQTSFESAPAFSTKDSFTFEETQILLKKLPHDKFGDSIRVMLASGIRLQELLGLEHPHIEPDGSLLHIRQAVKLVRGNAYIGTPKTLSSYRDVPLPSIAEEPIANLLHQNRRFLVPGRNDETPLNPREYRKQYYKRLESCGVRLLSPHCCRHTYISQMQASGVPMTTIQHLVGHTKEKMTAHYLHLQEEMKTTAVSILNSRFSLCSTKN